MGLDIYFNRFKRNKYAEFKEKEKAASKKLRDYEASLIEKYRKSEDYNKQTDYYDKWSEEEKAEHSRLYNAIPEKGNYGEEIGYFRKVNFLMEFFGYEGNCEDKEIFKSELEELQSRCDRVLASKDNELAASILPPQAGFFFGSTDIDEYYFDDVKEVKDWVDGVLETFEDDDVVIMWAWW